MQKEQFLPVFDEVSDDVFDPVFEPVILSVFSIICLVFLIGMTYSLEDYVL